MADYENTVNQLDAKLPASEVKTREQGGATLSYVEGHYVIDRLNKVIGQGKWGYSTPRLDNVHNGTYNQKYVTTYTATVRLWVDVAGNMTYFEEVGLGDGMDKNHPGKAHELAIKEAVTDALKRGAKNLGMSLGLALYDKEQKNVEGATKTTSQTNTTTSKPKKVSSFKKPTENKQTEKEGQEDGW